MKEKQDPQKQWAVKCYTSSNDTDEQEILTEIAITRSLQGISGIVKLKEVYQDKNKYYLVFEYAKDGCLLKYIAKNYPVSEKKSRIIME